jgi:hypothetical protein
VQLCFTLAGYSGKINVKKILREFGLRTVSRFLGLELATVIHFFALLTSGKLLRANRSGMLPASLPVSMPWTMPPATRAKLAGLRGEKLPDYTALTLTRGEPRVNSGKLGSRNSDYV